MKQTRAKPFLVDFMPNPVRHLVMTDALMAHDDSKIEDAEISMPAERRKDLGGHDALYRRHMLEPGQIANRTLYRAKTLCNEHLLSTVSTILLLVLIVFLPLLAAILI